MRRSTPITWEQARVGLVILVSLVILAVGLLFVGRTGSVFGERYRLVTLMESAAGLTPGGAVQLAGQPVGQVERIQLIPVDRRPSEGHAVAIWLSINRSVQDQIRADSRARVRTQGLLGDRLIDIQPGSPSAVVLQPGDTLEASEPLDYQRVLNEAEGAVRNLTDITRDLTGITRGLVEGEGTVGRLLTDPALYERLVDVGGRLDTALAAVNRQDGTLGRLVHQETLYDRLLSSMAAMDTVTGRLAAGQGTLGRLMASDSVYLRLAAAADRADSLLARLESGEGSAGRMLTDDRFYEELLRSVVELNAILADLRANPRKYVPPVEVF